MEYTPKKSKAFIITFVAVLILIGAAYYLFSHKDTLFSTKSSNIDNKTFVPLDNNGAGGTGTNPINNSQGTGNSGQNDSGTGTNTGTNTGGNGTAGTGTNNGNNNGTGTNGGAGGSPSGIGDGLDSGTNTGDSTIGAVKGVFQSISDTVSNITGSIGNFFQSLFGGSSGNGGNTTGDGSGLPGGDGLPAGTGNGSGNNGDGGGLGAGDGLGGGTGIGTGPIDDGAGGTGIGAGGTGAGDGTNGNGDSTGAGTFPGGGTLSPLPTPDNETPSSSNTTGPGDGTTTTTGTTPTPLANQATPNMCPDDPLTFTPEEQKQLDDLLRQFYRLAPFLKTAEEVTGEKNAKIEYDALVAQAEELTQQCQAQKVLNPDTGQIYEGPKDVKDNPYYKGSNNATSYLGTAQFDYWTTAKPTKTSEPFKVFEDQFNIW